MAIQDDKVDRITVTHVVDKRAWERTKTLARQEGRHLHWIVSEALNQYCRHSKDEARAEHQGGKMRRTRDEISSDMLSVVSSM